MNDGIHDLMECSPDDKKKKLDAKAGNSKYKILVVEDNPVNAKIVMGMLSNLGNHD